MLSLLLRHPVWHWFALASLCVGQSVAVTIDPLDLSLDLISAALAEGKYTSLDLTRMYLARIAEVNAVLHAVIELNPDALYIAADMDAARRNGSAAAAAGAGLRSGLFGVPVLVKDNIATMDALNTTAGSYALLGAKFPRDATVVRKLRAAGAIVLGKTNLSEWANYRSLNASSNGWSARGGQTLGAWYPRQDPSGSSSGSAVSASIALAAVTLGSETDGSIISPAEVNGVVGLKPTVGLVSRSGVIPISHHQDTVGPITRSVRDAARLLGVIAGHDAADNGTSARPSGGGDRNDWGDDDDDDDDEPIDYVSACNGTDLRGFRIAVPRQLFNDAVADHVNTSFTQALSTLRSLGATVLDRVALPSYADFVANTDESLVLAADFKADLGAYLSQLSHNPNGIDSLADLIRYTQTDEREAYPSRDTDLFASSLALLNVTTIDSPRGRRAVENDERIGDGEGILAALEASDARVLALPAAFAPGIAAIAGNPVVTVPMGYAPATVDVTTNVRGTLVATAPGLPFGLAFIARKFDEVALLRAAYAFEQATLGLHVHRAPIFQPATQLIAIGHGSTE